MTTPLTCPTCGAPLPRPLEGQTSLECFYCGGTASLTGARATAGGARPFDSTTAARVIEAFKGALAAKRTPFEALVVACRERLGPAGETDSFARVVFALGRAFDEENKTHIVEDPVAISRLIEGYFLTIQGLRESPTHTLNLPFLTATSSGPLHLMRTLSAADIAALLASSMSSRPQASPRAGAPSEPTEPPKKKKWWPFG